MSILNFIKDNLDYVTVIFFILIAVIYLLLDGSHYKSNNSNNNSSKEYKIIKAISYFYAAVGIALLVLLYI